MNHHTRYRVGRITPHKKLPRRSYPVPLSVWPVIWAIGVGLFIGYWLRGCDQQRQALAVPRVWTSETQTKF